MPSYNLTFDDTSPVIQYQGAWLTNPSNDLQLSSYANSTLHTSNTLNDKLTINFNGTGIYLYGAFRANHGEYTVNLDGTESKQSGLKGTDVFQQIIFAADKLRPDVEHQLALTNSDMGGKFVDIDYVQITLGDGKDGDPVIDRVDDANSTISYGTGWHTGGQGTLQTSYDNSTLHLTGDNTGAMTITFNGDAINLYGAVSTNHGQYSVSVDGGFPTTFNGTADTFRPKSLLYYVSGLGTGQHTLSLKNQGGGSATYVDFDYYEVADWSSSGTSSSGSSASLSQGRKGLNGGQKAGIVIGLLLFLAISAIMLWWFWWRRRRSTRKSVIRPFSFGISRPRPVWQQQEDMAYTGSMVAGPPAQAPRIPEKVAGGYGHRPNGSQVVDFSSYYGNGGPGMGMNSDSGWRPPSYSTVANGTV